jgi:hypothetical protein
MIRAGVRTDGVRKFRMQNGKKSMLYDFWLKDFPWQEGYGVFGVAILAFLKKHGARFDEEIPLGLAAPDHTVPYGTVLSRDAFPGTSCQVTIDVVPTGRLGRHVATATSYPAPLGLKRMRT